MKEIKVGLTLGKFAPLHKGHQYMIETARREMDKVIAVIYDCPETINIPLAVRADWLRKLYPDIEVIEAWDGPKETGYTKRIKKMHEDYVKEILNGQKITHFYSSERYGEHMSQALGAVNRIVDCNRETYPISGTQVRLNPYSCREFVSPLVYKSLITNIVFLGAPSTGKTTLTEALAKEYNTLWMPEYGREYWDTHQIDRRLTKKQLVEIAQGHIQKEEELLQKANRYLFTDTNAITTYMFSLYYYNEALPKLKELAKIAEKRYHMVFLCSDDIPYDDTWDRSGEVQRYYFQRQIINDLKQRGIPYTILQGSLQQRMDTVNVKILEYSRNQKMGCEEKTTKNYEKFFKKSN